MKTAIIILSMLLCFSLASASTAVPIHGQLHEVPSEPVLKNPKTNAMSNGVSLSSGSGGFLTKWVWTGEECVKADVLSKQFTIGKDSKYNYPFVEVKINQDGSRVIQKIIEGKYGTAWNPETRKVEKTPNCNKIVNTEPLPSNWFRQ